MNAPLRSLSDTIVAVSSPPGRAARGLVRLSGPATSTLLRHLLVDPEVILQTPRRWQRVELVLGPATDPLPALGIWLPEPRTYTGQAMAEWLVPGNPALLQRLLHGCIQHGARLAQPGEFTLRAFLAGKIDLTQAEGVAATIAAASDALLHAAAHLRAGELGRLAESLVEQLAGPLALVEAGIDFTDQDDVVAITPAALAEALEAVHQPLHGLLAHSRSWSALEALPRVVLVGAPSAGKSTLFNALLGHPRAVTSAAPGTTRDLLEEVLLLPEAPGGPLEIMLVDMAGLDEKQARGSVDAQAQAAAQHALTRADLLLLVMDATAPQAPALPSALAHRPRLTVYTKCDLPGAQPQAFEAELSGAGLALSSVTGAGLPRLRTLLAQQLAARGVSLAADVLALQPRHQEALTAALAHLERARRLIEPQRQAPRLEQMELIASELRCGLDALAALGGRMTPDDVIGRIFATFCIGK